MRHVSRGLVVLALATTTLLPVSGHAASVPRCHGLKATIVGTAHADHLIGTRHRDVIVAGAGYDVVHGRGGNDVVCGGPGADRLYGGLGDDRLFGGRDGRDYIDESTYVWLGDVLVGGRGHDGLWPGFTPQGIHQRFSRDELSWADSPVGVTVRLADGRGGGLAGDIDRIHGTHVKLLGSPYADHLVGTDGRDRIEGGLGADTIEGNGGADRLYGAVNGDPRDTGGNTLLGGGQPDVLMGTTQDDTILGGPGGDEIDGGNGADRLYGQAGGDRLTDILTTAPGQEIHGGPGADDFGDVRFDGFGSDHVGGTVDLGAGTLVTDTTPAVSVVLDSVVSFFVTSGSWRMYGTDGNEAFGTADDSPDAVEIHAAGGDDILVGGAADDLLDGGDGNDYAQPIGDTNRCVSIERVEPRAWAGTCSTVG